jgi:YD repeat-containing protein
MTKYQKRHRIIATFFLLIFFPTLIPSDIFASNNGPNSFEAASFEPVDATDMVNLVTGDLAYVLPLLNIPSPEGGYPLALSYHAGIAMDQEASWVGLGWNLNPGSINRNTNGYPDDIITGKDINFGYDQGESEFYKFGVGASIYGINAGVGAYWGSHKSFGGTVSFGVGSGAVSVTAGSMGGGVGLGYAGNVEDLASNISTGASFKTLQNQGGGFSSGGTGYAASSFSASNHDYNIQNSSKDFAVNFGIFNFHFGHTKQSYNLYKEKINGFNGTLYQNATNTVVENLGMTYDTNKIAIYNDGVTNIIDINDESKHYLLDNILLPSYDKYKVQAQGLSGSITPTFIEETRLKHSPIFSGKYKMDKDLFYHDYKRYTINLSYYSRNNDQYQPYDNTIMLNKKLFFEFENTNSSFLRIDRTNVKRNTTAEINDQNIIPTGWKVFHNAKTDNSYTYNQSITTDSLALKNNGRKRTGKFVETFTNEQILSNNPNINGQFIEAKNLNRNQPLIYRPESIGGYRITDIDGKTYHYSLPVLNYEIWYKNFKNSNNEDLNFIEREFNVPYATDWLLTAITGPDYVDVNGDKKVDKDDYGYWVEFDYGKWSDGYIWNGASGKYDIVKGDNNNDDRYEYYRGRKQIYYLDAVKTRTHTAYFVKSLRKDAQADKWEDYNTKAPNGIGFNKNTNPKIFSSSRIGEVYYSMVSKSEKETYNIPSPLAEDWISGFRISLRYADFPKHYSLKLDKIILVKNDKLIINKSQGNILVGNKTAYFYENKAFKISSTHHFDAGSYNNNIYESNLNFTNLKEIPIHQNENVIDVNDIIGLDINANADKIINFEYDANYSLMANSFHSEASNKGKLTLNAVNFLGKGGISYTPKYKFKYNNPSTPYDINNEDGWGYHKTIPDAWSLSQVITPIGSAINIKYESDDYSTVASKASRLFNKSLNFYITKNSANELYFEVTKNTESTDNNIEEFTNFNDYFKINEAVGLDLFICRKGKYGGHRRLAQLDLNEEMPIVTAVTNYSVTFKLPNNPDKYWTFDDQGDGWILNRNFSLTAVKHANGNNDGVIMRNPGQRECWPWRDSYDNDDVSFHYRLASSSVPVTGKGGGVRVKEISISDGISILKKLNYYYNATPTGKSCGATSFVPSKEFTILPYASELPPPIVIYSTVAVEEQNKYNQILSRTEYNFETFDNYQKISGTLYSLGNYFTVQKLQNEINYYNRPNSSETDIVKFTKHEIKSSINNLGRLLSIATYNSSKHLIYSLKNNYYIPENKQDEFGTKQESFTSYFTTGETADIYNVNSVSKIWYPNQLAKTTVTQGGLTQTTTFDKFDFLTGQTTETTTTTSDGQSYKTKIIPAYLKYPEMGSKVDNINNKNMLSQTAANYSYIKDNGTWKETGVGITTWSNLWSYKDIAGTTVDVPASSPANQKIWRKHKTYIWNGVKDANGIFINYNTTTGSKDDNFVWAIGVGQPSQWKQTSEVTLYDHYSAPLEMKDINGNYATTKMGDKESKVTAVGNGRYGEIFYSGGENISGLWLDQEVSVSSAAQQNGTYYHTGTKSISATSSTKFGVEMKNLQHRAGRYKISVWVEKTNAAKARINNNGTIQNFTESYPAGNWVLKVGYIDNVPTGNYNIHVTSVDTSAVYFDDLMIRPVASSITGYVYNQWDELTHIIGNNGLATRFEYDAAGRLIKTYSEVIDDVPNGITGSFKLARENGYNYKKPL